MAPPVWSNQQIEDQLLREGYFWNTDTVQYTFLTSSISSFSAHFGGFSQFNATQKAAAALAFQYFGDIVDVDFVEATGNTDQNRILLGNSSTISSSLWGETFWTYSTSPVSGALIHTEIGINSDDTGFSGDYHFGSYDFFSIMHEIGHSIGLAHPGEYFDGTNSNSYNTFADYAQDTRQYSVMSYFNASFTGGDMQGSFAGTPLLHDIMALQALYGANMTTRTGNTTYGFNNTSGRDAFDFAINDKPLVCIWDAGGTDTIDLSGYATDNLLTLIAGDFSDVGGLKHNVSIAFGATVENGIGGSGNDQIVGNTADNTLTGNNGDDTLTSGSGTDSLFGGAGNDTFVLGANFDSRDTISGGTGTDTLSLDGNYGLMTNFSATSVTSIEVIQLADGNDYNFLLADGNVAAGGTLTVDGSDLGGSDSLIAIGSAETDGQFVLAGGNGDDILTGGFRDDTLKAGGGGLDTLNGGQGDDTLIYGAGFNASDKNEGGAGTDTLSLNGDYGAVTFGSATMRNIEKMQLLAGHDYNLVLNSSNIAAGMNFVVDASTLGAGDSLTFRCAGDGTFSITSGAGADTLTGSSLNDTFDGGAGNDTFSGGGGNDTFVLGTGNDTASGGAGNDTFKAGANLTAADTLRGDLGVNTLILDGDYALAFVATTLTDIDAILVAAGHDYNLTFADANVAAGDGMTVDGSGLGSGSTLKLNASSDTDGKFTFVGGAGNDTMTGGTLTDVIKGGAGADTLSGGGGNDTLTGGAGKDTLNGGSGTDTFVYGPASDSSNAAYDTVVGFDANGDRFDLSKSVTGIDASVTKGKLSAASFNTDMKQLADSNHLAKGHAVLITGDSGDLRGEVFLVVECSGKAGYQPGNDLVIHLDSAMHLANLDVSDFI